MSHLRHVFVCVCDRVHILRGFMYIVYLQTERKTPCDAHKVIIINGDAM